VALSSNANTLSPAAGQAGSRLGGDRASQSIAVGGQRIMYDYYTLDGVNNTDPDFVTYVGLPSIDGIQEFKVQTGVYSAEYGHEASQINVVSKSGTNLFHGAVYDFIRNNYVDAFPYYFSTYTTTPRPTVAPYKWNDYGFEFDGPIWIPKVYDGKDKFFFMVDDEWRGIRTTNNAATATLPTALQEQGNLSNDVTAAGPVIIYDPTTGVKGIGKTQISCNGVLNVICPGRISLQSQALMKYYPAATTAATGSSANYQYSTTSPQNRQSLTVRGDYYQSPKSQFAFRYGKGNENITTSGLAGAGGLTVTQYDQYMASNTYTLNPNVVNELRGGYNRFYNSIGLLSANVNNVIAGLNIPNLQSGPPASWGIPTISFGQLQSTSSKNIWSGFGDINDDPYVTDDMTWSIVDNVSVVKGKHSLTFGFEYAHQVYSEFGNQFSRGAFNFDSMATAQGTVNPSNGATVLTQGDAFADFLLGDIQQTTFTVGLAQAHYIRNVESFYGEDTYKLTPKLTISAGLRYELTPPWLDTDGTDFTVKIPQMPVSGTVSALPTANGFINTGAPSIPQSQWPYFVREGNCSNAYSGLGITWLNNPAYSSGGVALSGAANPGPVCSNSTLPGALMATQHLDLAPRVSFAYAVDSSLVIRAGYGTFFNQDIGNAYFDMARNVAGRVTNSSPLGGDPVGVPDQTWSNAIPAGASVTAPYAYADAQDHKTSSTQQFLLNIQKQVGKDWAFETGYLGALNRHLYGFQNANAATPYGYIGNGASTSIASRTPFPNFGVIQLVQDTAMGNYNAFSLKATRRFSNGFNVIGSYTLSKSLSPTSGIRTQGNDQLFTQNRYCIECDYGPSSFDVRNRVVVSVLYLLPIGPGKLLDVKGPLNAAIGGWEVGGIFTHQTGPVAEVTDGTDNASIGTSDCTCDRPNATGLSPYIAKASRTLNVWANKAAYTVAPAGTFGNVSENSYVDPGYTNFDASLHKEFQMPYSEKHQLSIRFEAFNALNHPNWSQPSLSMSSSTFGRISGTGSMRQLQLAAKYHF
jgi:hypothetical protein